MCGFVAAIALAPEASIDRNSVEQATDALIHRGPDSGHVVHDSQFSFGHRRLSIIDLDARSDQPFADPSGAVVLVYNGWSTEPPWLRASKHACRSAIPG